MANVQLTGSSTIRHRTAKTAEPKAEKRCSTLHDKYAEAVKMYAETDKTQKEIAGHFGFSVGAFRVYMQRYHRDLLMRRHGIAAEGLNPDEVKIISAGKQSLNAHRKYGKAVEACDSMDYIELNLSQVAHRFGLNATALANFMRVHYAEILTWRERVRVRLGIADNIPRGMSRIAREQYAEAVRLYSTTDMTLPEVSEHCRVSEEGLSQHLRFYHREILEEKKKQRSEAMTAVKKKKGAMLGNGRHNTPSADTERKYAKALAMYRDTDMTMKDIVARTGVSAEGFRFYLHKWHKPLVLERAGVGEDTPESTNLRKNRGRTKIVAAKYAPAIESLKANPRSMAAVAVQFGHNPDVFRQYLHKYEPELIEKLRMSDDGTGHRTSLLNREKYESVIRQYVTTAEPLRAIAKRMGVNVKSVDGYIRRNCPEVREQHRALLMKSSPEADNADNGLVRTQQE